MFTAYTMPNVPNLIFWASHLKFKAVQRSGSGAVELSLAKMLERLNDDNICRVLFDKGVDNSFVLPLREALPFIWATLDMFYKKESYSVRA